MLTLITGLPGSGKTLKLMSDLKNRKDLQGRPLYIDGVPGVNRDVIPYLDIPEGESMQTWYKWAPTGAILVIDECQRVFRPRPSGSKVPEYVSELETHRHRGLDFFLLTQHPRLIDSNLRSLIGHHTHISKTTLGIRRKIEWQRCANPEARNDIKEGLASVYKLDKSAFGIYKSAEEHTVIKTKRSKVLFLLPVAILAVAGGIWKTWDYIKSLEKPASEYASSATDKPVQPASGLAPNTASMVASASGVYPTVSPPKQPEKPHLSEADYKPAIEGKPWTAPMYDGMNKAVVRMPYPAGCIKTEKRCTCYTDQATPLPDIPKKQCLDYVKNGIYNPYKQRQQDTVQSAPAAVQPEPSQVAILGGESKQNLMYDGYVDAGKKFN